MKLGWKTHYFAIFTILSAALALAAPDLIFALVFTGIGAPLSLYMAIAPAIGLVGGLFFALYFVLPLKRFIGVLAAGAATTVLLALPPLLYNPSIVEEARKLTMDDKLADELLEPGERIGLQIFSEYADYSTPVHCSNFCAEILVSGLANKVAVLRRRIERKNIDPWTYDETSAFVIAESENCVSSETDKSRAHGDYFTFTNGLQFPRKCIAEVGYKLSKLDLILSVREVQQKGSGFYSNQWRKTVGTIYARRMIAFRKGVSQTDYIELQRKTLVRYDEIASLFMPVPVPTARDYGLVIGPWPSRRYLNTSDNEYLNFDQWEFVKGVIRTDGTNWQN